ncbi:MerR family transcriptional regulator [Brachybacterium sp. AOP43-C2-M15]|uniref:MerR family transcriptional regulator n=1 Tax=Brachybacterium sp. AOP43-C2-M15 TaxID=3457661 RepID=UPI0040347B0B
MRIGELSRRTGVAPRLLRYYEEQGLIASHRASNGYRTYDEEHVERVRQVAVMIRSGLTTRLARALLELEEIESRERAETCSRGVAELLAESLHDIEGRIECLSRSRDTIRGFLARTEHRDLLETEHGSRG